MWRGVEIAQSRRRSLFYHNSGRQIGNCMVDVVDTAAPKTGL